MSVYKVPDFQDREEAIMTANHAFVWASAGTGKTQTLALRALYLLLNAPFFSQGKGEKESPMGSESSLYSATSRSKRLKAARVIIRSLVLTTFTRKAAAEMQTRLYGYLDSITMVSSLSDLEAKNPDLLFLKIVKNVLKNLTDKDNQYDDSTLYLRLRAGAQVLGELAAELQISTIHSLASSILRRYPLQTGIPLKARFAREEDEGDLVGVEDRLVDYWWQRVVMEHPKAQKELVSVAKVVPITKISAWLKWSYQFPWIVEEAKNVPLDDQKQTDQLVEALQALVQVLEHINSNAKKFNEVRNSLDEIVRGISSKKVGDWVKLCSLMHKHKEYLFLDGNKPRQDVKEAIEGLNSCHAQYFQSWIHFYSLAARICIAKQFDETWKVWVKFLERFINWADGAGARELELVTFDEMIQAAVKLLEENPRIRRAEQVRLRAILVDEFQDTDRTQLRLFQALLTKDAQDPHEVLGFFVGDKKQSIYGFRGSDVPVITDFHNNYQRRTGCGRPLEDFYLKTNFRSTRQITDFTNYFFNELVTLTDENDILLPSRPDQKRLPEWILIDKDTKGNKLKADSARECSAYETLLIIQEYLDQPDTKPADILVLVRTNKAVDVLLPVLQKAGIPTVSVGTKTFYLQPEVLDVLNFLIALLNPEDSLAVAAILRSPFVYLSDPDIYALLKEISPNRLFHSQNQLPEFLPQQVELQIKEIRQLVDKHKELTLTEWLQQVRNFIPLGSYSDSRNLEGHPIIRIDRLLGSFQREMEVGVMAPLVWLLKQRERAKIKSWKSDFGEDINVIDESVNAVRVMTIHQAKGLQGRLVIVCGWASVLSQLEKPYFHREDPKIYCLTNEKECLSQGFLLNWGPLEVSSADYAEAFRCKEQSLKDEEKRIAYVAITRACDRLVLICTVTKSKQDYRSPGKGCFSSEIKSFINNAEEVSASQTSAGHKTCGNTLRFFHRTPSSKVKIPSPQTSTLPDLDPEQYEKFWKERKAEWLDNPALLLERPSDPESKQLEDTFEDHHYRSDVGTEVRLLTGRLVHDYLEQYLLEDQCRSQLLFQLASNIPGSQDRQDAVEEATILLTKFYTGQLVDTLGISYRERLRSAQILGRETPIYLAENGKVWNGVIDLVMEHEDSIQVIDYKATEAKDPLPASYIQQQRIYTEALKRTFPGRPVTFEFWWLYA